MDAAFAKPSLFIKTSKKAKLAHIYHTYHKSRQIEDEEIYKIASNDNYFVVTINYKHFRHFTKKGFAGVITLISGLSTIEMDQKLCDFVSKNDPSKYIGKLVHLK